MLNLSTFLETIGRDPNTCDELSEIRIILEEAFTEKSKLDDLLFSKHKKGSIKAFKQSVATLIEGGKGPSWMSRVCKDELINQGGTYPLVKGSSESMCIFSFCHGLFARRG